MSEFKYFVGNVGSREQAEKIRAVVDGKTYYDFQVWYSPDAGNYPVTITANNDGGDQSDILGQLVFLLACSL